MRTRRCHSRIASLTRWTTVALCVAGALWTVPSRAAERSVHLTFVGAPGCDDEQRLAKEVERRAPAVRWSDAAGAAAVISVRIVSAGERIHSVLFVRRTGHPGVTRAITGRDCQELLAGTALVIALLVSGQKQAPIVPPRPTEERVVAPPASMQSAAVDGFDWRFGGGVMGALVRGVAPGVMPGADAFLNTSAGRTGLAPAFRLGFRYLARSGFAYGDARAAFTLASGFGGACPTAWAPARRFTLRPCATASLGSLEASGSSVDDARSERHPFASAGGALRLEVRLGAGLSRELETGAEVSLTKNQFRFGDAVFHETAPVTGRLALGVSGHTP